MQFNLPASPMDHLARASLPVLCGAYCPGFKPRSNHQLSISTFLALHPILSISYPHRSLGHNLVVWRNMWTTLVPMWKCNTFICFLKYLSILYSILINYDHHLRNVYSSLMAYLRLPRVSEPFQNPKAGQILLKKP